MSRNLKRALCAVGLLVPLTGVTVRSNCQCNSGFEVTVIDDSVAPPSGPIAADTVDISLDGIEVYWGTEASYWIQGSISKWDPNIPGWRYVPVGNQWQASGWQMDPNYGVLSHSRTFTITWPNVPLTPGENRFAVGVDIDGSDGCEDRWASLEVTYQH